MQLNLSRSPFDYVHYYYYGFCLMAPTAALNNFLNIHIWRVYANHSSTTKNTVSITILRDHAHFTSPPMSQFHIHPYINSILQNMFFCSLNPHPNKKKIKSFPTNKRKCFLPRSIKCYRQHYSHPYLPYSPIFAKKMKNTSTVLIDVLNLAV